LYKQTIKDLQHTETAKKVEKARRTESRGAVQKGGVLYASETRSMLTEKVVNELGKGQLIVGRAAEAEAKTNRKGFLMKLRLRREIWKVRVALNKLRKELG
jgi:hypothetical protein